LYAIVTPVLYREPVVQDLGLLIRGIERPLPDGVDIDHAASISSDEEVPLHKLHALALIKRLYLVHASSRKTITPELWTQNKAYEFPSSDTCRADALAHRDMVGWENVKAITKRARRVHGESFPIFQHVGGLALGSWDDGRWTIYINRDGMDHGPAARTGNEMTSLLVGLEPSLEILRSKDTCRRLRQGLYSLIPPNLPANSTASQGGVLSVRHAASIRDIRGYTPYAGPTRLYIDIGLFIPYRVELDYKTEQVEPFKSYDWALYPIDRVRLSDEEMAKGNASVEICLVSTEGDQVGLDLAVKVKRVLEEFHEEVVKRKGKDRLWKGKVRILVGDEVPVCPCCGTAS
jgi:hypothetical protein